MSVLTATNNEALGKLLADLFPNVAHSGGGIALLAAQISDLEERCATMQGLIDHKPPRRKRYTSAASTAAGKL
jgi:hypothetical protein